MEDNGHDLQTEDIEKLQHNMHREAMTDDITGLMNIHRRLLLTFGEGSGLFLSRSELQGLKVVIRIQWNEGEQECIDF